MLADMKEYGPKLHVFCFDNFSTHPAQTLVGGAGGDHLPIKDCTIKFGACRKSERNDLPAELDARQVWADAPPKE